MGSLKRTQMSGLWCVLVIAGGFLLGGALGCMLGSFAAESGMEEVTHYLRDFLALARSREVFWSVPSVLWNRGRWLLCCGILALSGIGAVALPVLFGLRGFLLAFGVSCFVRVFGVLGLIPSALLFAVPALLWAPGFLLLGIFAFKRSCRKGEPVGNDFRNGVFVAGIFLVLCVVFECGLLPRLMSAAACILE